MKFPIFVGFFHLLASCGPQESEVQSFSPAAESAIAKSTEKVVLYMATAKECLPCKLIKKTLAGEVPEAGKGEKILILENEVPVGLTSPYKNHIDLQFCHVVMMTKTTTSNIRDSKNEFIKDCQITTKQASLIVDPSYKEFNSVPFFGLYLGKTKEALASYTTLYVDGEKGKGQLSDEVKAEALVGLLKEIVRIRTEGAKAKQPSTIAKAEKEVLPDAKIPDAKANVSKDKRVEGEQSAQSEKTTVSDEEASAVSNEPVGFMKGIADFMRGFFEAMKSEKSK